MYTCSKTNTDIQAIDSVGVPPLPIPNREVKPNSADGTAKICGRVGHRRFFRKRNSCKRVPLFLYIWHRPPLPVMLACRIPRGYIFAVASRDHLLLALTKQPSVALWESRGFALLWEHKCSVVASNAVAPRCHRRFFRKRNSCKRVTLFL